MSSSACGDRFTAADLTFAALAASVLLREYAVPLPQPEELPVAMAAVVREFRAHPAGVHALAMFRHERRQRAAVGGITCTRRIGDEDMKLKVGNRIKVEAESTERSPRTGVIEEVVGEAPSPRYRIRWDDGHQSIYAPAAGAVSPAEPTEKEPR